MKKIAIGCLILAITAVAADMTFPELRCWIGLENCSKPPPSPPPPTSITLKSAGLQPPSTQPLHSAAEAAKESFNESDSQAEADIWMPEEGSEVDKNMMINGWLEKTPRQRSFLIIKPQEFEQLYPQGEIFPDKNGQWQIKGTYPTRGYYYETFVVVTHNPNSAKQMEKSRAHPLRTLPEETEIVSDIIVVQRSLETTAPIEPIEPEFEVYEEESEPEIEEYEEESEPEIEEEIKPEIEEEIKPEIEEEIKPEIEKESEPKIEEETDDKNDHAVAQITFPEAGSAVEKRVMITGILENSTPEQRRFLIIKSQTFGKKLYPQGEIFPDESGQWTVKGIYYSPGYNYETFVVITNNFESAKLLENQRSRAYGLKTLPEETEIISDIIVVKRQ